MPRAMKVCSTADCPELTAEGRCAGCRSRAERSRGTARQRGYDREHENRFRDGVLYDQPVCVCTDPGHGHGNGQCYAPATVADHYPRTRRELARLGLDPHDPGYGRGLCRACHDRHTAATSPGGWAAG